MTRTSIFNAISLFIFVILTAGARCDSDTSTTKRELCYEMADAYCSRAEELGCSTFSSCYSINESGCDELFLDDCKASSEDKNSVDHDIDMIILPKETCDGLISIDSYITSTLLEMAATCEANDDNNSGMDIGYMCEALIGAICSKIDTLGCDPSMTLIECESSLATSGTINIDTHSCDDFGDHTPPTTAQKGSFDSMMAEVQAASTCADFGY